MGSLFSQFGVAGRILLVSLTGLFWGGCTQNEKSVQSGDPLAQKSGSMKLSESKELQSRRVNLAIWSNYIPQYLVDEFYKQTGIQIQISNYSSNEELLAKLQAGAAGYDVVVPSDYMVFAMSKLGLLQELNLGKLSHLSGVEPRFLKRKYDPKNQFSVPYDWGTTGIAVNHTLYSGSIVKWMDLFTKADLAGKFSFLDDAREVLGAALKALGYSLNSKNPDQLKQAKELVLSARDRVKEFTSEPLMPLVNGETAVAHSFMSDALQARKATSGKIDYRVPQEGGTLWIDNLVIPQGALHVAEAYELINFLLESRSNYATVMSVFVSPVNRDVFNLLPPDLKTNPALFPSDAALSHCEMIEDLGDFLTVWDRTWTEIKARHD